MTPVPDRLHPNAVRLAAFYAAFFVVVGILQPFWPLWLAAQGLTASEIGTVLALWIGAKVFGLPIAAHVADRTGRRQRPMWILAISSVAAFALFGLTEGFWPILLVSLLFSTLWPPVMSLAESLTMMAARAGGFQYGRIRLWGSMSYIGAALISGQVLARTPADVVYWMILGSIALTAGICLILPDLRAEPSTGHRLPVLTLLGSRPFVLMLAACGLVQGSHAVYYAFGTLHWQAAGYSEGVIGALWAEGVICEVVLFAYGSRLLQRIGADGLIGIAGAAAAVRWLGTGLTDDLAAIVALQSLHALSFGAAHLGAMHWIGARVAPALSATAQSLYSAVVWGLFLGGMLYAAGFVYADLSALAYLPMAVAGLIGGCLAIPLIARPRGP